MRRVGQWLGVNYRFHRYGGCWSVVAWKRVPGNPRNEFTKLAYKKFCEKNREKIDRFRKKRELAYRHGYSMDKVREMDRRVFGLERSEPEVFQIPMDVGGKDAVIDWLLLESGFLQKFGSSAGSYEELEIAMSAAGVDKAPYRENA